METKEGSWWVQVKIMVFLLWVKKGFMDIRGARSLMGTTLLDLMKDPIGKILTRLVAIVGVLKGQAFRISITVKP
jgi:hypothetical protein